MGRRPASSTAAAAKRRPPVAKSITAAASPPPPAGQPPDASPPPPDAAAPEIEVLAPPPPPPQSFVDRMKAKLQAAQGQQQKAVTAAQKSHKKKPENILETTVPLLAAGFITVYAAERLPDKYRACGPTREESLAIVGPLCAILARYVSVDGHMSPNQRDIMASLLATLVYGTRAAILRMDIKEDEKRQQNAAASSPASGGAAPERGNNPVETRGAAYPVHDTFAGIAQNGSTGPDNGHVRTIDTDESDSNDADSEAAKIASLFARDKQGRVQLGLLPGRLPESG